VTSLAALINLIGSGKYSEAANLSANPSAPVKVAEGGGITSGMDTGHPMGATHVDSNGNYYDENGNLVG
jgi:hypothetical protein